MTDLRSRFREADRLPAPDLWEDIVTREPMSPVRPSPWPRVLVAAAALTVAALGLVVLVRAFFPGPQPGDQPSPTPTGAFRPEPKANGLIAFVRTDPESTIPHESDFPLTDLHTVQPEGGGARRLVRAQGFLFRTTVAWSPDGSRIAFPWPSGIRVTNTDGSGIEDLTTCQRPECHADAGGDSHPSWSPDGTRVAFSRFNGSEEELWVVGTDGGDPRPLNQEFAGIIHVAWSPRGDEIAVLGFAGSGPEVGPDRIYLVDVETGQIARTLDTPPSLEFLETISWSPDGEFLAFDAVGEGGTLDVAGVYVMRADGTNGRPLTVCPTALGFPGGCTDMRPAWSPDGTQIAFTRALPERGSDGFMGDIFVIDADGGEARRVTSGPGLDCCPAWQPLPGS